MLDGYPKGRRRVSNAAAADPNLGIGAIEWGEFEGEVATGRSWQRKSCNPRNRGVKKREGCTVNFMGGSR